MEIEEHRTTRMGDLTPRMEEVAEEVVEGELVEMIAVEVEGAEEVEVPTLMAEVDIVVAVVEGRAAVMENQEEGVEEVIEGGEEVHTLEVVDMKGAAEGEAETQTAVTIEEEVKEGAGEL